MADSKITDLNEMTTPVSTDVLPIVDDPGGTPETQKITLANLLQDYLTSAAAAAAYQKLGSFFIPAGALTLPTTSPAKGYAQVESSTNKQNQILCDFVDGSTTYGSAVVVMPSDYNGGTFTATFYWRCGSAVSSVVRWQVEARSYGDLETIDQAFGTAVAVDDTYGGTASQLAISAATAAVTPSGTPAGNELMHLRFARLGGHANDTMTQDARLVGVRIDYTRT